MKPASTSIPPGRKSPVVKAILYGGLIAGLLDLAFAFIFYGSKGAAPLKVLQSIAGGVMGKAAYHGGITSAALGVSLHFLIALGAAAVFCAASVRFDVLLRHATASGLIFGAIVYYVMNLVVLPLSALQTKAFPLVWAPWPLAAHLVLVGLPIAWTARRCLRIK